MRSPLVMSNQVVQIVSEFSYLGVMVNSRGNWEDAWSKAYKKASLRFHEAVLGGTFIDSGWYPCGNDEGCTCQDLVSDGWYSGSYGCRRL